MTAINVNEIIMVKMKMIKIFMENLKMAKLIMNKYIWLN
jgi:hypothetical protein